MAITEDNGGIPATMLVSPSGYGGNGGMFGGMGGDWLAWFILVLLIGGNGWGMGGFGMGGMMMPWLMGMGGMGGGFGLDYLYPWLNNSQHISDGFRDQQLNSQIGDLRTDVNRGFGDVQLGLAGLGRDLCQTGNQITGAVRDGFSAAEIAANGRQMANMQQGFALQTQLADCCCKQQTGIADLKYTVASEECATRNADTQNTTAVLNALNSGFQSIRDQLCAERIERKDDTINQLRSEVMFYREQTARDAQVDQIYNRFRECPVDTTPVFGHQPIFTCPSQQNNGCGCGSCGNFR